MGTLGKKGSLALHIAGNQAQRFSVFKYYYMLLCYAACLTSIICVVLSRGCRKAVWALIANSLQMDNWNHSPFHFFISWLINLYVSLFSRTMAAAQFLWTNWVSVNLPQGLLHGMLKCLSRLSKKWYAIDYFSMLTAEGLDQLIGC